MNIINIILGSVILLTGRQLFWLFLGILGFLGGASLAQEFLNTDPAWLVWILAIILGLVGAILAFLLQRVAVMIAGFIAGWVLMTNLAMTFGWEPGSLSWALSLMGGLLGAGLLAILYDPALIFLSSITGATTIVQSINLDLNVWVLSAMIVILVMVGVSVQYRAWLVERDTVSL